LGAETDGMQYSHVGGFDWAKKKFPRIPVNWCNKLNAGLVPGYQARRRRFWEASGFIGPPPL